MGQFSILERHLAPSLAFLPLPIPMPLPQAERQPDPWGTHGWEGRSCRVQAGPVEGRCLAPRPHFPPPSIFRSIIVHSWVYFFPTPSPEKQIGFLQAKPSRLPWSWCVGAHTLPDRHEISELSNHWISRLHHVSRGRGGGQKAAAIPPQPSLLKLPRSAGGGGADRDSTLPQQNGHTYAHARAHAHTHTTTTSIQP